MCVKEKTAVLSQQGWTWQSADRPFKNNGTNIIFFCSNKSRNAPSRELFFPFGSAKLGTKKSIPLQCNEMLLSC